jgi:site-specific recombinase XerD
MRPEQSVFGLKARSVVNKFYVWKRKAGVSISAHDLRRRFATDLDSAGVRMTVTQQLMGHEDVSTTQRYIAVPTDVARQAIELRTSTADGKYIID